LPRVKGRLLNRSTGFKQFGLYSFCLIMSNFYTRRVVFCEHESEVRGSIHSMSLFFLIRAIRDERKESGISNLDPIFTFVLIIVILSKIAQVEIVFRCKKEYDGWSRRTN
jgi:hypothetical protein